MLRKRKRDAGLINGTTLIRLFGKSTVRIEAVIHAYVLSNCTIVLSRPCIGAVCSSSVASVTNNTFRSDFGDVSAFLGTSTGRAACSSSKLVQSSAFSSLFCYFSGRPWMKSLYTGL